MRVIIAAAGTGGHINPGIAIANKIKEMDNSADILFIGTQRGLENDLVPRAGYKLETIEAYGIERKISLDNLKNMCKTIKSFKIAKEIVKKYNPDIVIGTGGYICGPVIVSAQKLKIPTVLHESNAFPGVTVKLLSKKSKAVLVGFKDAEKRLPKAKKVIVTGTPTKVKKINFPESKKAEIISQMGLKQGLPIVLVFGGSQGAKSINNSLIEIIKNKLNKNYQIMWAAGPKQYDKIITSLKEFDVDIEKISNVKIVPYIYNMEEMMNVCDVIISRSGAMTITEVSRVGKPAIFIPFPFATENHQEYNAKVLADIGAARIILDKDLSGEVLEKSLEDIISSDENIKKMGELANSIAVKDVEQKIYEEILKVIE